MMGFLDVHAHHYPQGYLDACLRTDSPFTSRLVPNGRLEVRRRDGIVLTVPTLAPDPQERLALMSEANIDHQVLSVPSPSVYAFDPSTAVSLARDVNDELAAYAEQGDGRLSFLLTLPLPSGPAAIEEIERWRGHALVQGVLVCSHLDGSELNDPGLHEFWSSLDRVSELVLLHPTSPACLTGYEESGLSISMGFMHEQSRALARLCLSGFFDRYPRLRFVASHLGGGIAALASRLEAYWARGDQTTTSPASILERIHYDVALCSEPALISAISAFGSRRIVLGTDFPHFSYGMGGVVDSVLEAGIDADVASAILGSNARRLLNLQ